MSHIVFFTKPGCQTGIKQIEILQAAGHAVEVRDLFEHPWNADELLSYFGDLPVEKWFNPNAPRVKSGEVSPASFDRDGAIAAMLEDYFLIRRPLIAVGTGRKCGFDLQEINEWVGVSPEALEEQRDLQSCSAVTKDCTP